MRQGHSAFDAQREMRRVGEPRLARYREVSRYGYNGQHGKTRAQHHQVDPQSAVHSGG
jgi:hypothetical protein